VDETTLRLLLDEIRAGTCRPGDASPVVLTPVDAALGAVRMLAPVANRAAAVTRELAGS
jgi:hypothetical protein